MDAGRPLWTAKNEECRRGDSTHLVRWCMPLSFLCLKLLFSVRSVLFLCADVRRRCCTGCCTSKRCWTAENRLSFRNDVTDGARKSVASICLQPVSGDACSTHAVALSLMYRHQVTKIARHIRCFVSHLDEALAWVIDY